MFVKHASAGDEAHMAQEGEEDASARKAKLIPSPRKGLFVQKPDIIVKGENSGEESTPSTKEKGSLWSSMEKSAGGIWNSLDFKSRDKDAPREGREAVHGSHREKKEHPPAHLKEKKELSPANLKTQMPGNLKEKKRLMASMPSLTLPSPLKKEPVSRIKVRFLYLIFLR
mgnify:CR=1 FL=1